MALEVTPGVLNDEVTDSVVQRHTTAALAGDRQGVCGAGGLVVSQQSTPGMGVRIGGGYGLVRGSASALQGMYSVFNDAPDESVAISPGDPSNPRNDIVGVQVQDHDFDGSTQRRARWHVVEGTPAVAPVDPTLPASFLPLARVRVAAGLSSSVTNAAIDDLRVFAGDAALRPGALRADGILSFGANGGGTTSGTTPLTLFSSTFTPDATGRLNINAHVTVTKSVAGDRFEASIVLDGTGIASVPFALTTTDQLSAAMGRDIGGVAAGSHTVEVRLARISGSGTATAAGGLFSRLNGIFIPN